MSMERKRVEAIKKSIALAIKTEQEAYEIISELVREDWTSWIANTKSTTRWIERPCVICRKLHRCGDGPASGMCGACYWNGYSSEISKLSLQRTRASKVGLSATLTLREWYETVDYFNGLCAYCLQNDGTIIEHFIPIGLGGGTTKNNCVLACRKCNRKKHDLHPDEVVSKFNSGSIERVRAYLQQF